MPSRHIFVLCATGAAAGLALVLAHGPAAIAAEIRVTPTVEITEEYSTNIDLERPNREESAFVTRATPGAELRARSARMDAALNAGITVKHQTAGQEDGVTQDITLTANGDFELARDRFFLETDASISQQVLSSSLANSEANQETVQTYRLSPVFKSHLGGHAAAEVRYALEQVFLSQDVSNQTTHRGSFGLESGRKYERLIWGLDGSVSQATRSEDDDVTRAEIVASGEYAVTRWLQVLAEVGYQHFDDGDVTQFDAPVAVGGFRLRPSRRSELEARFGRRDDDTYLTATLRHAIGPRTSLSLVYDETLSTSQERLANTVSALGRDDERDIFIDERFETPFNPKTDPFDIDNETERIRSFTAIMRRETTRTTIALSGGFAHEEKQVSGEEETNIRVDLSLSRRLSRKVTARASLGYERIEFDDGQVDNEYLANAGLGYEIWRDVEVRISYAFRTQSSTAAASEFIEHSVLVGLRRRF